VLPSRRFAAWAEAYLRITESCQSKTGRPLRGGRLSLLMIQALRA